jgi:hypothetical protein
MYFKLNLGRVEGIKAFKNIKLFTHFPPLRKSFLLNSELNRLIKISPYHITTKILGLLANKGNKFKKIIQKALQLKFTNLLSILSIHEELNFAEIFSFEKKRNG